MEMIGRWAIVNNNMECLEIYEGDLLQLDTTKYENYGGEVGIHPPYEYRNAEVGKVYSHETDKFE